MQVYPLDAARQVVAWQIEIENVGQVVYATIPGGQVFVAEVNTNGSPRSGQWWASAEAAQAVGIALQPEVLDVLEIQPGQVYRLTLTAFTPIGNRFGLVGCWIRWRTGATATWWAAMSLTGRVMSALNARSIPVRVSSCRLRAGWLPPQPLHAPRSIRPGVPGAGSRKDKAHDARWRDCCPGDADDLQLSL
ncbi:MAG: hypothetical protein HC828_10385 [Blastochloris sp.]|nr:hypothetical protein [Blastochloris sp.]